MTEVSGFELARIVVDCGSEYIAPRILPCCYRNDRLGSRIFRSLAAIPAGVAKVFLFPIACLVGLIVMPFFGCFKAGQNQELRRFDSPCVAALLCFLGLAVTALYLGGSAYGYLNLRQSIGIFLGAIAVSVVVHLYFANKSHTPQLPALTAAQIELEALISEL